MQQFCAWLIAFVIVLDFFGHVYFDFNGRPASEPRGYAGFLGTVFGTAFVIAVYYFAGFGSLLFPR